MDFASKTTEGIQATVNYFDDKPNTSRIRYPRVFYNTEQYYSEYNKDDSHIVQNLQTFQKGKWATTTYIGVYKFEPLELIEMSDSEELTDSEDSCTEEEDEE